MHWGKIQDLGYVERKIENNMNEKTIQLMQLHYICIVKIVIKIAWNLNVSKIIVILYSVSFFFSTFL